MKTDPTGAVVGAMRFLERKQQVITHNLANVSTRGFKGERIFAELIQSMEGPVIRSQTDVRNGGFTQTGSDLDVALDGEGFFVVETARGMRYTRGGSFSLNERGQLVDETGARVLGQGGEIVLPPGKVEISSEGMISVDGIRIDTLRIESPDPGKLRREEGVYFVPDTGVGGGSTNVGGSANGGRPVVVLQGHLEQSNVSPVDSMVEMIEVMRSYSLLQRSFQSLDQVSETIANDLSRIG